MSTQEERDSMVYLLSADWSSPRYRNAVKSLNQIPFVARNEYLQSLFYMLEENFTKKTRFWANQVSRLPREKQTLENMAIMFARCIKAASPGISQERVNAIESIGLSLGFLLSTKQPDKDLFAHRIDSY